MSYGALRRHEPVRRCAVLHVNATEPRDTQAWRRTGFDGPVSVETQPVRHVVAGATSALPGRGSPRLVAAVRAAPRRPRRRPPLHRPLERTPVRGATRPTSVFIDWWWPLPEQDPLKSRQRAAVADPGVVSPRVERPLSLIELSYALRQAPIPSIDASGVQTGPDQHADTEHHRHPRHEHDGVDHRPHRPVPARQPVRVPATLGLEPAPSVAAATEPAGPLRSQLGYR